MKTPKLETVQVWLILAGVGVAAYAAWKVYRTGDAAANQVKQTVGKIGDWFADVGDSIGNTVNRIVRPSVDNNAPYPEPIAIREAERLAAQPYPEPGPVREAYDAWLDARVAELANDPYALIPSRGAAADYLNGEP